MVKSLSCDNRITQVPILKMGFTCSKIFFDVFRDIAILHINRRCVIDVSLNYFDLRAPIVSFDVRRFSVPATIMPELARWFHRGSTNTEPGAVATGGAFRKHLG